jgi:hypothetical protein
LLLNDALIERTGNLGHVEPWFGGRHEGVGGYRGAERVQALHQRADVPGGFIGAHGIGEGGGEVTKRCNHA